MFPASFPLTTVAIFSPDTIYHSSWQSIRFLYAKPCLVALINNDRNWNLIKHKSLWSLSHWLVVNWILSGMKLPTHELTSDKHKSRSFFALFFTNWRFRSDHERYVDALMHERTLNGNFSNFFLLLSFHFALNMLAPQRVVEAQRNRWWCVCVLYDELRDRLGAEYRGMRD